MDTASNPVFHPTKPTRFLISPGHGAGWKKLSHGKSSSSDPGGHDKLEDLMTIFHHDANSKFGVDRMVTARVGDLFVEEMAVPFEIRELNGQETLWDVSRREDIVLTAPTPEVTVVALLGLIPVHTGLAMVPPSMPASEIRNVVASAGGKSGKDHDGNNVLPLTPALTPQNAPASAKIVATRKA
ncbi:hypothetical protein LTR08_000075 [Meristemomyces frigidus]|nr:hypothetical protein LTR08_000075 [Meristemomyces frigidus]